MTDNKKITIYEVAHEAGVSRQTVSRVLNNRPDVAPETRARVKQVIQRFNYKPSAIAQSLSRNKSYIFGVVTAGLKYIGPSRTLSGITTKAEEIGYGLLLKELSSFTFNDIGPLLDWFQSHQVDGIIWATPEIEDNHEWLDDLLPKLQIPIIFLAMEQRPDVSIVSFDNFLGAKMATQHLLDLGRTNVGHIAGPLDWWEARQRKLGWEAALLDAGHTATLRMWSEGNWSSRSGKTAFQDLLGKFPEMDGVFAGNDQMALSILQTAFQLGIDIPDQLAVVGFDGIPESEYYCPPLTTVFQNHFELGCAAVGELEKVIEQRNGEHYEEHPVHLVIGPELIIRRSSMLMDEKEVQLKNGLFRP
jgi:DNA-binding LacI/PurR family transcriptional regulator